MDDSTAADNVPVVIGDGEALGIVEFWEQHRPNLPCAGICDRVTPPCDTSLTQQIGADCLGDIC